MNERKQEKRGLGRGLAALMSDVGVDVHSAGQTSAEEGRKGLREIPIDTIEPNPEQPRRDFDAASLEELSESIRRKGVLQPLVVRPFGPHPGKFQIVAGERRWRAAQLAGLHAVPALVRTLNDSEVLEIAIIENIQREDLNPLEEAIGYRNLIERFGHTQEQVAGALGKSRSHIANLLRLLNLPAEVQDHLRAGRLSAGHARALITSADPAGLARRVIQQGLSVRETEILARQSGPKAAAKRIQPSEKDADTRVLEQDISANLGMGVTIDHRAGGESRLTIKYRTLDDLDQLCRLLSGG
ncbi:ParB/RepB/Spo0J family partition protein [Pararhodobacter sp. SW119]|uniref:ParB/RepB/Spo0J family partition protein n=1 Tax=Pararhodobacter sp. SW119 TaxID=2780075 RepID=UPI001ADF07EF|nr:ParB/RepB/Spo0J family partition protein [Pararhodobacter sp. SW119]